MPNLKLIVALLACSLAVSGCAKKKGGAKPAGKPAASATAAPAAGEILIDEPGAEKGETKVSDRPARFSDEETGRFDNSRYKEVPQSEEEFPVETADNAPDTQDRENETSEVGPAPSQKDAPAVIAPQGPVAEECPTAYAHDSEMWFPGLPVPPSSKKFCTGGSMVPLREGEVFQCEGNPNPVFTDARQDGLMALTVEHFNRLPKHLDLGSRELSRRVRDLKVAVSPGRREVRAQVTLLVARLQYEKFEFRGVMGRSRNEQDIRLISVNAPRGLRFSAVLTCADADGGCSNAIFRLQQLTNSGKVGRVAYIVSRTGEAHVSMSEQDRTGFRSIQNPAHAHFAEFLSNTAYNACVDAFREIVNGDRKVSACHQERLKKICGSRAAKKGPAAKDFFLRSWAVAYGRSGFEFEMMEGQNSRFIVKGPLVLRPKLPMSEAPLQVSGSFAHSIENVIFVANDGGGNINLQINFRGESKSQTRINVTTMIPDIRYSPDYVNSRVQKMPGLSKDEAAPDDAEIRREDYVAPPVGEAQESVPAGKAVPHAVSAPLPPPRPQNLAVKTQPQAQGQRLVPPKPIPNVPAAAAPKKPEIKVQPKAPPSSKPSAAPAPAAKPGTPAAPAEQGQLAPGAPQSAPGTGGVPPRETDDNGVIQPSDDAL